MATEGQAKQTPVLTLDESAEPAQCAQLPLLALTTFPAASVLLPQGALLALGLFVAQDVSAQQMPVLIQSEHTQVANCSSAPVLVLTLSNPDRRTLKAWTYDLDGHSFYVLKLGELGTVVYDVATGQWSEYATKGQLTWRAQIGRNWESEIVAGDDKTGQLWYLRPNQGFDADGSGGVDLIERVVTGFIPVRMRETLQCQAAYLTGSVGTPINADVKIRLRTSDDGGRTWLDHGEVSPGNPGEFKFEVSWRSLGLISDPHRIFEISDSGAMVRIDGLDIPEPE